MISPAIIGLVNNIALLLALGLIYDMIGYRSRGEKPSLQQVFTGIILGTIGIAVMLTPWELTSGVFFDTRSVLLSISGLFFGTLPTLIAVSMTAALRFFIGGTGAWPGIAVIITSGGVGIAWRHLRKRELVDISIKELYGLGIVVHVIMLLCMLILPWSLALDVISQVGAPVMIIHPVGTAMLGWLMINRQSRKRTELQLQVSESRYKALFERSSEAIFLVDTNTGRYLDANLAAERLSGRPLSELQRLSTADVTPQNALERLQLIVESKRDAVDMGEVIYCRPDGSERTALLSTVSVQDGLAFGLARDITERKQAVLELSQQKALFEAIFACIPDAIVYTNIDREVVGINPAFSSVFGYTMDDLRGKKTGYFYESPEEYERQGKVRYNLTADERALPYEVNYRRKDGSVFPGETLGTQIKNSTGTIMGYIGVIRDISERKQADAALLESRERYISLFNNMLDGIYRSTPDGKFVNINPAMVNMFGFESREEMLQVDIKNELYFAPEERGSHILDTGQEQVDVYRMRRKDGSEIWVEDHGHYVHDEQGRIIYHEGILRDVTARRQAELAIQHANAQLHAQLIEIKELGMVLREQAIRDPLTGLFNRRFMEETLKKELAKAIREEEALSLVMLDLDNLKETNDLYGHAAGGDKALQALTECIQPLCRMGDTFCRYAGDEFIIILYKTSIQAAYKRTLEWRDALSKVKIVCDDGEFGITFSAGVSEFPSHGSAGNKLIQHADKALYRAKKLGRNRVVVAEMPEK